MTQHQKILKLMFDRRDDQIWFFPYDFMPPRLPMGHPCFVGYEASARVTELAKKYPDMIASERAGKYIKRRINWEDSATWFTGLPKDLKQIMSGHSIISAIPPSGPVLPKEAHHG